MATVGKNYRLTASREQRDQVSDLFQGKFGCSSVAPTDDLTVFTFEDGTNMGFCFVEPDQALGPDEAEKSAWFEFCVPDVVATKDLLQEAGYELLDYTDKEHHYFRAPWGLIFRLA